MHLNGILGVYDNRLRSVPLNTFFVGTPTVPNGNVNDIITFSEKPCILQGLPRSTYVYFFNELRSLLQARDKSRK